MSYIIKAHNPNQLERLTDEDLRWYCTLDYWTLVEAPFILTGHRPPTDESTRHFLDHSDLFPYEFREALNRAVEVGVVCQRVDRAGQRRYGDSPASWFAWVDGLDPKHFKFDERVRQLLPGSGSGRSTTDTPLPRPRVAQRAFQNWVAEWIKQHEDADEKVDRDNFWEAAKIKFGDKVRYADVREVFNEKVPSKLKRSRGEKGK